MANNKLVIKCAPGAVIKFAFVIVNDSNQDWVPDTKIVCRHPLVEDKAFALVLGKQKQCRLTFEVELPEHLEKQEISLAFMASSAEYQGAFGDEMNVQLQITSQDALAVHYNRALNYSEAGFGSLTQCLQALVSNDGDAEQALQMLIALKEQ